MHHNYDDILAGNRTTCIICTIKRKVAKDDLPAFYLQLTA